MQCRRSTTTKPTAAMCVIKSDLAWRERSAIRNQSFDFIRKCSGFFNFAAFPKQHRLKRDACELCIIVFRGIPRRAYATESLPRSSCNLLQPLCCFFSPLFRLHSFKGLYHSQPIRRSQRHSETGGRKANFHFADAVIAFSEWKVHFGGGDEVQIRK